jgi:hypothetical protein
MSNESKHVTHFRKKHLKIGEKIISFADGYNGVKKLRGKNTQCNGSLIVTNLQAIFYRKCFLSEVLETMALEKITHIVRKPTLGFRTIVMHSPHNQLSFKVSTLKAKEQSLLDAIELGRRITTQNSLVEGNILTKTGDSIKDSNKFMGYFL